MFATAADIERFALAGKSTITIESGRTGTHFTYQITKAKGVPPVYFVSALTGSNNETDYSYIGILTNRGVIDYFFKTTAKTKLADDAPALVAFKWFWQAVRNDNLKNVVVRHDGNCGKCGRKLTTPESIDRGIGPECAKSMGIATPRKKIDRSDHGRRMDREAAVKRGDMIEAKEGETMRLSRGTATVVQLRPEQKASGPDWLN